MTSNLTSAKKVTSQINPPKKKNEKVSDLITSSNVVGGEKSTGSWFGGWFKRGAAEDDVSSGTPGKPIKAKLGEESSFYYDKDLKKWVNKKVFRYSAVTNNVRLEVDLKKPLHHLLHPNVRRRNLLLFPLMEPLLLHPPPQPLLQKHLQYTLILQL
jgi:hypothetical protein